MKRLNYQKGRARIIAVILLAVILIGGVFAYQKLLSPKKQTPVTISATCIPEGGKYGAPLTSADLCCAGLVQQPTSQSGTIGVCIKPTDATANWKTYTNTTYGFSLKYPASNHMQNCAGESIHNYDKNGLADGTEDACIFLANSFNSLDPSNFNLTFFKESFKDTFDVNKNTNLHKGALTTIDGKSAYISFGATSSVDYPTSVLTKEVSIEVSPTTVIGFSGFYNKPSFVTLFDTILSTLKFTNPVADYFNGSELQAETDAQRQNIAVALNDALNLSENQLKEKRYQDYSGKANQWDLPTLIYRHFVPDAQKTLGDNFFTDVKKADAQEQIKQILKKYFQSNAL